MKKITSKLLLLMMVLVMAFGLAACGSDDKKETTTGGTSTSGTTQTQTQAPAEDKKDSSKMYSSLSEYLNDAQVKETLSTLEKSLDGTGMNMKITSEDNKLIYTFTYEKIEKTDEMAAQLEKSIKTQDATFQSTANQIKQYVDVDSAIVAIKYIDSKGEEIFSKEYVSE